MQPNWVETLQAEFAPGELRTADLGARGKFTYISARSVAARFDTVFGPGGWQFDWEAVSLVEPMIVKGTLMVKLEGEWVKKSDAGYQNAMPNREGRGGDAEPVKSAVTDAMRRCASLWGVGRYLYGPQRNGVSATNTQGAKNSAPAQAANQANPGPRPAAPAPATKPVEEKPAATATQDRVANQPVAAPSAGKVKIDTATRAELAPLWGICWNRLRDLQRNGIEGIDVPVVIMSRVSDDQLRDKLKEIIMTILEHDPDWVAANT